MIVRLDIDKLIDKIKTKQYSTMVCTTNGDAIGRRGMSLDEVLDSVIDSIKESVIDNEEDNDR